MRWYSSANWRVLDPIQIDERPEGHEPALDLGLGRADLAGLALLLGVELGEAMGVALARVAEAALGGIELGLRGVEARGRLVDRPFERGEPAVDLLALGLERGGFLAMALGAAPELLALVAELGAARPAGRCPRRS